FFAPDAPHSLLINSLSFTAQCVPCPPIPEARPLSCNLTQALTQLLVAACFEGGSSVSEAGTANATERAAAALGEAALLKLMGNLTLSLRAQQFFASTSLMASISRQRSASRRLSRAFSCSNSRRRRTSGTCRPPYFCRQR